MRVLIVDDEPAARRRLAIMLDELDIEVVGEAENGVAALELASERRPDVLLLDISMPEVDGFDVARHLAEPKPLIVFQTAYDEFALQAFDHAALDYLVKPVSREMLERALERAQGRLDARTPQSLAPDVLDAVRAAVAGAAGGGTGRGVRILVRERGGHRLLPHRDVVRFVARDGAVYAHTARERYLTDYTLREIEARTAGAFVRASRSELVGLEHVMRITGNGDGSATLGLSDGGTAHVSRRRAAEVRRAIEG